MNRSNHEAVRRLLRTKPDGLTVNDLSEILCVPCTGLRRTLKAMPDAYIDRFVPLPEVGQYAAVWCAVEVPEDCPHPARGK